MYNIIKRSISPYDDCAGLYVDGARDIYLAENTIERSQFGLEIGSEEKNDKYSVKNIIVKNNILRGNTVTGIRVGGYEEIETGTVQNNFVQESHTAVVISKAKNITFAHNQMLNVDKYFFDMEFSST